MGTLVVKVPRQLVAGRYWIYVNGKIVGKDPDESILPHVEFTEDDTGVTQDGECIFVNHGYRVNADGTYRHEGDEVFQQDDAILTTNGKLLFHRRKLGTEPVPLPAWLGDQLFEHHSIQLAAPGSYIVEVLADSYAPRRSNNPVFPFARLEATVDLAGGESRTIEFGVPPWAGKRDLGLWIKRKAPRTSDSPEQLHNELRDAIRGCGSDPIVLLLDELRSDVQRTPLIAPTVFVNLPTSVGGGRELDADQVERILRGIEFKYGYFVSIEQMREYLPASSPLMQYAESIVTDIGAHNGRIEGYREIVTALKQAARE